MKSRTISPLFRKSGILLAFSALTSLPLQAADPAAIVPDDSVAYLEFDNAGIYKLENHPVVKAFPQEELKKLMYKMSNAAPDYEEQMKKFIAEETGVSYDDLVKKAGKVAVTVHDLKIPANPTPENVGVEVSVAYEFDADEAFVDKYIGAILKMMEKEIEKQGKVSGEDFQKALGKISEHFEQKTAEHGGAKIHVFKLKESDDTKDVPVCLREWAYAVHDKMILAASGQEQVEEMIDRMKSGSDAGSLAASAYYKADHDKTGKTLSLASLNLETILGLVEKHALPHADSGTVDVAKVWSVLGADKLKSAILSLSADAETLDLAATLTYSEKPGLISFLALPGSGPAPAFLPKGLASAGYQQIEVSKTVDNLEKLIVDIYPDAGPAVAMGMMMVKQQTGVDIREEILGQLGPDIWTASSISKEEKKASGDDEEMAGPFAALAASKAVTGIRVKDSRALGTALKTLINKAAQEEAIFEKQEYQGFTINVAKGTPDNFKVAYVLTDDWLILSLGDQPALEQILSRLGKSGDDGFFAQKNITRHLNAMRDGQVAVSVSDVGAALSSFATMFGDLMKSQSPSEAKAIPFDELSKLLNVPLVGIDKTWVDAKSTEYRVRIAPKGE